MSIAGPSPDADPRAVGRDTPFVLAAVVTHPYAVTAICAAVLTIILMAWDPTPLARYLGDVSVTGLGGIALGYVGLQYLRRKSGFRAQDAAARAAPWILLGASLFGGIIIVVDLSAPFPREMNVAWPKSLLFYPAIAVYAEIAFHVIPLALLVACRVRPDASLWLVALIEPTFQTALGWGQQPPLVTFYVWLHIFLFSRGQLELFRRFGWTAMLGLRLAYYAVWHVAWGTLRLGLFPT